MVSWRSAGKCGRRSPLVGEGISGISNESVLATGGGKKEAEAEVEGGRGGGGMGGGGIESVERVGGGGGIVPATAALLLCSSSKEIGRIRFSVGLKKMRDRPRSDKNQQSKKRF